MERLHHAIENRKRLENGGFLEDHLLAVAPYEQAQPILDHGIGRLVAEVLVTGDVDEHQAMRQMVQSLHRFFDELTAPVELPECELPY